MIRSIHVVSRADVEAAGHTAARALVAIGSPGCDIALRPDLPALRLSFDTLAGELEAASIWLTQALPAVPFDLAHAQAILAFTSALHGRVRWIDLMVWEHGGHARSVTIARWLARRYCRRWHEPASTATVASCPLMQAVLRGLTNPAQPGAFRVVPDIEQELLS